MMVVLFIGMLWPSINFHSTPPKLRTAQDVLIIYENLWKYTGWNVNRWLPLDIDTANTDKTLNAFAVKNSTRNYYKIVVSGGSFYTLTNGELAFILAHEIGHVVLHHDTSNETSADKEGAADKYGAYLLLRSGQYVCEARNFWDRLIQLRGDYQTTITHPSKTERYWSLSFPICGQ